MTGPASEDARPRARERRMIRSWLYVPGDRPDRMAKALAGPADAVVLDLEDAVGAAAKDEARRNVLDVLASGRTAYVRVNDPATPAGKADLKALAASPGALAGVRVPKSEDPGELRRVAYLLGVPVYPLIESALGVENALALATATRWSGGSRWARRISWPTCGRAARPWPGRGRASSSRRAPPGCPSPAQSVWTAVRDLDGLRADTEAGREARVLRPLGHPPVADPRRPPGLRPDAEEIAGPREVLDRSPGPNPGRGGRIDPQAGSSTRRSWRGPASGCYPSR